MSTVNIESDTAVIIVLLFFAGLDVEGLYRVSGKANDILRIKKQFDNGKIIIFFVMVGSIACSS